MSRKLGDLHPALMALAETHLALCAAQGIDLLVTCTYRSNKEQAELYAQGRSAPGKRVTNAKPGESKHNLTNAAGRPSAEAYDVVPVRNGKAVWDDTDPVWQVVGELGESLGLEWAGRWARMREYPHFQWRTVA